MGGCCKPGVPSTALSAPGYDEGLVLPGQVFELLPTLPVPNDRSAGDGKKEIRSAAPLLVLPFSVLASFGVVLLAVPKIEEGGELPVGLQKHVPAFSPVAAVGTSAGNVLFMAKTDAAVSSIAALDEDFGFIDELNRSDSRSSGTPVEPG
jgi:hydrogenase-4 membrane subunit HyfE